MLDGVKRSRAAMGQPLADAVIIETSADTRLLRIEWPDGQSLNLGPATRVMLQPPGFAPRGKPGPALYLLQGWAKYNSALASPASGLATERFALGPFKGVVVVRVDAAESWAFVQSGSAPLSEIRAPSRHELASGSFYARSGTAPGTVVPSAPSKQLTAVPRAFRDTLPLRYSQATANPVKIENLPAPSYTELQPWLVAKAPANTGFTLRFRPLLRDRSFRKELDAHLTDHPEWRPILYPPPPPPPPSAATGR